MFEAACKGYNIDTSDFVNLNINLLGYKYSSQFKGKRRKL